MDLIKGKRVPGFVILGLGLAAGTLGFFGAHAAFSPEVRFMRSYADAPADAKREVFENYIGTLGSDGVLDILEDEFPGCHSEAHPLGRVILHEKGDVHEAVKACSSRCTGGCFHGILFELFGLERHLEFEDIKGRLEEICSLESISWYINEGHCMHVMGHVVTNLSGHSLEHSLEQCAGLQDARTEFWCATGVFMEYGFSEYAELDKKEKSLHYPCDVHATKYPAACYRYQTRAISDINGKDLLATVSDCAGLRDRYARLGCFYGLGFVYSRDILQRPELLADVCRFGGKEEQTVCVEGVSELLGSNFKDAGQAACMSLEGGMRSVCTEAVERGDSSIEKPLDLYIRDYISSN